MAEIAEALRSAGVLDHREVLAGAFSHIILHRRKRSENPIFIGFPVVQILGFDVRIKATLSVELAALRGEKGAGHVIGVLGGEFQS